MRSTLGLAVLATPVLLLATAVPASAGPIETEPRSAGPIETEPRSVAPIETEPR
jgi:hypothetical protein